MKFINFHIQLAHMTIERIVYSVSHVHENVERAASFISPDVTANNKVGLEVSEADLKLYDEINSRKLSPNDAEKALLDAIIERYGYDYSGREEELPQPLSFALFWYGMYNELRQSGAEIKGLGSEKRIRLLNMYAHGDYSTEFMMYSLISGPHFDSLLTERILENGFDRVVIGLGHAAKVADRTNSKLVVIDDLPGDLKHTNDAFERIYQSGRYTLPDLRD